MKILFIILIVLFLVGGMILLPEETDKKRKMRQMIGVICVSLYMSLWGVGMCIFTPPNIKSSKFKVKTEIRQEFLNGQEISRDTVYIFTPKKSK